MEFGWFLSTVCVCLLWCVHSGFAVPIVRSTPAGEIQGYTDHVVADGVTKDITRFLGIPYAEPPTGSNRFAKPVPKSRFNSVFNASVGSTACIQSSKAATAYYSKYVTHFTEDCLSLNIYVPNTFSDDSSTSSLSTMVWIHGGGYKSGAAGSYNPDVLSVTTNTIVVTVNYRLGMFGFLQSKDGSFKGNQGLWDQHLAFKWVNQNIGMFYGSSSKVTIFGESAGGEAIMYQALYPGNKGLFQRVIAESGTALASWALMPAPNAEKYFEKIGCMTSDPQACISLKTHDELQVPYLPFGPVIDGDIVLGSAESILYSNDTALQAARELYYSLDIMTGVNQDDGAIVLHDWANIDKDIDVNNPQISRDQLKHELFPNEIHTLDMNMDTDKANLLLDLIEFEYINWSDPDSYNTTRRAGLEFSNDLYFYNPAVQSSQSHLALGFNSSTYLYEYRPKASVTGIIMTFAPDWITGAYHTDEIEPMFGYPLQDKPSRSYTQEEKQMSRVLMALWSNFAKSGDPNKPFDVTMLTNSTWPEYDMTSQRYLELSNHMSANSVKSRIHAKRMRFWSYIVPTILNSRNQASTTTSIPTTTSSTTTLKPLLRNLYIYIVFIIMLS